MSSGKDKDEDLDIFFCGGMIFAGRPRKFPPAKSFFFRRTT